MFSSVPPKEKNVWYTIPQIRARKSEIHGLGLFATEKIHNGTMVERSPVIICDRYTYKCLDDVMGIRHILSDYPFRWNKHESAFALGYSSLINHSTDPNILFKFNYDYPAIEFYAKKTIEKGEELLMQYVPDYALDKLWFETGSRIDNTSQITPSRHIGLVWGSFDLMNVSHIRMLKHAKEICQYLIVAVSQGSSLHEKHNCEPVQDCQERLEIVGSCKHVNETVLYKTEKELYGIMKDISPDILILENDRLNKNFTGYDLGIETYYCDAEHNCSSSTIKEKVFLAETLRLQHEEK